MQQFPGQPAAEDGSAGAAGAQPGQPQMGQPQMGQPQMGQPIETGNGQFQGGMGGPPSAGGTQQGEGQKTTLWMGELEPWIDENFIRSLWFGMGEQVNVKMIRDKFTGLVFEPFGSDVRLTFPKC